MPDLFAHFASGYLVSQPANLRQNSPFLVLGTILPDILTRIPEIIFDRLLGIPVFHFVIIFHSPFCLLLSTFAISLLLDSQIRLAGFFLILMGSFVHVILDLMQKQFGQAVYMPYFPFSFETLQWGLFHYNASISLFPVLLLLVIFSWIMTR